MNFSALASIIHSNIRFSNELSGLLLPLNVEDILRSSLLFANWKNNGRKKSKMEKEKIWESIDRLKLFLDIGIYLSHCAAVLAFLARWGKSRRGEKYGRKSKVNSRSVFFLASYLSELPHLDPLM